MFSKRPLILPAKMNSLPNRLWRALGLCLVFSGSLPALPAADSPAVARNLKQGQGEFVSFHGGTLTLKGKDGDDWVWTDIDDSIKTYRTTGVDEGPDRGYRPAATTEALGAVKPGTKIFVGSWFGYDNRHGIFIGVNRTYTKGTLVSFRDGNLSLLSVGGPKGSFTKKYGNSLFIRGIPEKTPVEESIDGAPYAAAGTAKTILPTLGEGSIVTVEFLGEGNITRILVGEPAK